MTTPYGFLTTTGRAREAAALANGTAIDVAEIAWGDSARTITGGETALGSEVGRADIAAQGQVPGQDNVAFFRYVFAAEDGPFTIHEAGLFASDGALLAIVSYPIAISKPLSFELTLDLYVAFSDLQNLVINVTTSSSLVPSERLLTAGKGLTGGGDLSQDRQFAVNVSTLDAMATVIDPAADQLALHDASAGVTKRATLAAIVSSSGAVASERVLTAGKGLTGGGDLSQDRQFALNVETLDAMATTIDPAADLLALHDASAGVTKRATLAAIAAEIGALTAAPARDYFKGQM